MAGHSHAAVCSGVPALLFAALLLVLLVAQTGWTQSWPDYALDGHQLNRTTVFFPAYLNLAKLIICLILFWIWVRACDWVNRDCENVGMPLDNWNMVMVFPFLVLLLMAWTVPVFAIGFLLLLISLTLPLSLYVLRRNELVEEHERVFTWGHIQQILAGKRQRVHGKNSQKAELPHDKGPPVGLIGMGAENELNDKSNLVTAQEMPGFVYARESLFDALSRRAERVMLDYSKNAVSVRNQIDGVWLEADPYDREMGDSLLYVLKKISALNMEDRRSRQEGQFGIQFSGKSSVVSLLSQGTKTGERVILLLDHNPIHFASFEDLGMRPKMQTRVNELLHADGGMVLFSSLPGCGQTTTLRVAVESTDRFLRHVVSVQDVGKRESDVDNVEVTTFDGEAGETPATVLDRLLRTEPEVLVVPNLSDVDTATILCEQTARERLVIGTIRAKEATEALLRVLKLNVSAATLAPAVTAIVNQRHIRLLCQECRQAYQPTEELTRKLGLPPGRVEVLYREAPQPIDERDICKHCGGIGYRGRTAIFELLEIDESIRQAIVGDPRLDVFRSLARKNGQRTLQQEGIVLVAQGNTSLSELTRVLKQ